MLAGLPRREAPLGSALQTTAGERTKQRSRHRILTGLYVLRTPLFALRSPTRITASCGWGAIDRRPGRRAGVRAAGGRKTCSGSRARRSQALQIVMVERYATDTTRRPDVSAELADLAVSRRRRRAGELSVPHGGSRAALLVTGLFARCARVSDPGLPKAHKCDTHRVISRARRYGPAFFLLVLFTPPALAGWPDRCAMIFAAISRGAAAAAVLRLSRDAARTAIRRPLCRHRRRRYGRRAEVLTMSSARSRRCDPDRGEGGCRPRSRGESCRKFSAKRVSLTCRWIAGCSDPELDQTAAPRRGRAWRPVRPHCSRRRLDDPPPS